MFFAESFLEKLTAQTTHEVAVSNFKFEPANLSIAPGDIVKWTNNEGTHSIDGTQAKFSNNPVSFSNSSGGPGWTFSFTFSTEGIYDYECGVHGSSMTGKITVGNATGIENNKNTNLKLNPFPNPTNGLLNIMISEKNKNIGDKTLTIFNMNGAKLSQEKIKDENNIQLNVEGLPKGQYFYQISSGKEIIVSGKFLKLDY